MRESYGYLSGTHARDKDAVNAVLLICEAAAWYAKKGMTLGDAIDALYAEFGCYCNAQKSFDFAGETGMEKMASLMQGLRTQPLREIAGLPVEGYTDYEAEGTGLPKANVLEYRLPGGSKGHHPPVRHRAEDQGLPVRRQADRGAGKRPTRPPGRSRRKAAGVKNKNTSCKTHPDML